jgi:hypothetical protein
MSGESPAPLPAPAKSPWYTPTANKFLALVLLMQGVLFLSSHYRWFAFNQHKGYTVLITVAATVVLLTLLLGWVLMSWFFKRKQQFSLATLMLMVPVMAIPCGWLGREIDRARNVAEAKKALYFGFGPASFLFREEPHFLESLLGREFFKEDLRHFQVSHAGDRDLEHLAHFTELEVLSIGRTPEVNRRLGMMYAADWEPRPTDAGIRHLRGLTRLKDLDLSGTDITDAGLAHLKGLTSLANLNLAGTLVTVEGVEQLKKSLPRCTIYHQSRTTWSLTPLITSPFGR